MLWFVKIFFLILPYLLDRTHTSVTGSLQHCFRGWGGLTGENLPDRIEGSLALEKAYHVIITFGEDKDPLYCHPKALSDLSTSCHHWQHCLRSIIFPKVPLIRYVKPQTSLFQLHFRPNGVTVISLSIVLVIGLSIKSWTNCRGDCWLSPNMVCTKENLRHWTCCRFLFVLKVSLEETESR